MQPTRTRSYPLTTTHMVLNRKGIIIDTSEDAAHLSGFGARQGAIGHSAFDDIAGRQRRYRKWLEAALQRTLLHRRAAGTDWKLTVDGWHLVQWTCALIDHQRIDYQSCLITDSLPYAHWIAQLDYRQRRLDLAPLLPGAHFDRKDLAILRLELCEVMHKIIAERVGVSISTVEHRRRRISRLIKPISDALPGSSALSILNAVGLDTFVLANQEWLAYSID